MYGSTEVEFEREKDLLLIIMTLHIDGRTFPSVVKINEQILIAWKLANIATEPSIHKMFEAEARRLHMNVNIQPYWNDNFIHEVWFSRMMTDYHGFYNDASVTIGLHGWELTISSGKTQEFLETVQSIYEHSPRPTPPFNATEVLTFIEKGDSI